MTKGRPPLKAQRTVKIAVRITPELMARIKADRRIKEGVLIGRFIENSIEAYLTSVTWPNTAYLGSGGVE